VLLFLTASLLYSTYLFGLVSGEEFAPETFQRRNFHYYQIPLLRIQVTGIRRTDITDALERKIASNEILDLPKTRPLNDPTLRWDVVMARRSSIVPTYGDARILCRYLDSQDAGGSNVWMDWTTANPKLARVVWRHVHAMAVHELYVLIPELFELARTATDPDQLDTEIEAYLTPELVRFATAQSELGRHALAVELFTLALERDEDLIEALNGRAAAYEATGQTEEAAADRAAAKQLASDDV